MRQTSTSSHGMFFMPWVFLVITKAHGTNSVPWLPETGCKDTATRKPPLEHFGEVKRHDGIQMLIGDDEAFVSGVEGHSAHHPQHTFRPADGPSRRHISIVVDAPDPNKAVLGGRYPRRLNSLFPDAHNDLADRKSVV